MRRRLRRPPPAIPLTLSTKFQIRLRWRLYDAEAARGAGNSARRHGFNEHRTARVVYCETTSQSLPTSSAVAR